MKEIRKQVNELVRPLKKELWYYSPSHIVLFGGNENKDAEYVFIFEQQIDEVVNFLMDNVDNIVIHELGRTVARIFKD